MSGLFRFVFGVIPAAIVTLGLFFTMVALISGTVEIDEKTEVLDFEINPRVDELEIVERETKITQLTKVTPPPPPPQVQRQQTDVPTESIASVVGELPEFKAPEINRNDFAIAVSDRDAQPIYRAPPTYPMRALERGTEGQCLMRFNVNEQGSPIDVVAVDCSSSVFERASISATQKFKYQPKIQEGRPVRMIGVETTIKYQLKDG